jgi:hypothetical protein
MEKELLILLLICCSLHEVCGSLSEQKSNTRDVSEILKQESVLLREHGDRVLQTVNMGKNIILDFLKTKAFKNNE